MHAQQRSVVQEGYSLQRAQGRAQKCESKTDPKARPQAAVYVRIKWPLARATPQYGVMLKLLVSLTEVRSRMPRCVSASA